MIKNTTAPAQPVGQVDIGAAIARFKSVGPDAFGGLDIVSGISGLQFCLNMRNDPIQNSLRGGSFYERDELDQLAAIVPARPVVLDVGANIGNHALYFATKMAAQRVIVIEPNPLALVPLIGNIILNKLEATIDMRHLGIGLSDVSGGGYWMKHHERNLGATKLQSGGGDIAVRQGDALFVDVEFDLIKIDVEGMEINVLHGLHQTITRCRPVILVEVDSKNQTVFEIWTGLNGYRCVYANSRNSTQNCNYIIVPDGATTNSAPAGATTQ